MKLYAFTASEIPKHNGYLKIGETNGDVEKRVDQECHELNVQFTLILSHFGENSMFLFYSLSK
jgi:hypothetical protein